MFTIGDRPYEFRVQLRVYTTSSNERKKIERGEQEKEDKSDILENFLKIARALSRGQFERLFRLIHDHEQCKSLIAECDPNFSGWQKLRKSAKTSKTH